MSTLDLYKNGWWSHTSELQGSQRGAFAFLVCPQVTPPGGPD